ncbi:MAG: hypothetical protein FWH57_05585 [Oscillospiraceae bacterium]|nr:hypothetical protein [Oscillospiraceae bacterium]
MVEYSNQNYNVIFACDLNDERIQFETESKGCLFGTVIEIEGKSRYQVNFYNSTRFKQDVDEELKNDSLFYEENIVIVEEFTRENLLNAISCIVNNKLYEKMVPH